MINVAVMGYGTVGSGVVEVIEKNKELVSKKALTPLHVKYILDLRDFPDDPFGDRVVKDFNIILDDPEVQIVCETMGGVGAAYQFTKASLEKGKSVCTSNKELVAKHGPELLKIAREHSCNYLFEASVGGGIPIIRPLNYSLTAEKIEAITGILNGTTNFILTKMQNEGAEFEAVLKEAQAKGYAEKDPTADIEGYDACRKIAILGSLMMGKNVDSEKLYTEGISKIAPADFSFAKKAGYTIKLLGYAGAISEDEILAYVAPHFVELESPLAMVNGVFNAVMVTGNMLGDSMYYGRGAGKLPTASAVVSDVIDCARHQGKVITCFWDAEDVKLSDIKSTERAFYIRGSIDVLDTAKGLFNGREIGTEGSEFGYITEVLKESDFDKKAEGIKDKLSNIIRIR